MKKHTFFLLIVFASISLIYCFPILDNIHYWGQKDWDQFTFWNAVPRTTLLKYHQFPLWNPYTNGGNVLLALPHSSFLSPMYICVLIWGPLIGLKLEIIIHLTIGLMGIFWLTRHMKFSSNACFLASFVYMLSSIYALHLTEGHVEWLAMAFVPWFFIYYLKSFNRPSCDFRAVVALGLILLGGSVYVFNILVVFMLVFALLKAIQLGRIMPLKILMVIFIATFLLCAIKLIPMLEFLTQNPRFSHESSGTGLTILWKMLLGQQQAFWSTLSWEKATPIGIHYEWHEYGAYVGVIPLLFYGVGSLKSFKENWPLLMAGFVCLLIAMGSESPVNLWKILHSLPIYKELTVPSRFILGFIFSLAILTAAGFSYLENYILTKISPNNIFRYKILLVSIVLFVALDLYQVNSPIFKNAFRIPPPKVSEYASFAQRYDTTNFFEEKLSRSSMYPIFLSNSGLLDGYEVVNLPKGDLSVVSDEDYKGEVYLAQSHGKVLREYFSPNKIVVDVDVTSADFLIVNQNYNNGWKAEGNSELIPVRSSKGLISTPLPPGRYKMTFYYRPASFLIGLSITLTFILLILIFYLRKVTNIHLSQRKSDEKALFGGWISPQCSKTK